MTIVEMIVAVQSKLGLTADGVAGPQTWGAIYRTVVNGDAPTASDSDITIVDPRSESNIQTLHPHVRPYARALVHAADAQGITVKIISGTRTYEEQDALYEQGRSTPGEIVTKARGGFSNHNFGIAFDVAIFAQGKYMPESPLYKVVGGLGSTLGLNWGGNWQSIIDEPHFELHPNWAQGLSEGQMLSELRRRHDTQEDVFA